MADLVPLFPTMTRRKFLAAVAASRIVIAQSFTMWRVDHGYNRRCESATREALAAGWVRLGADGCTYELTEVGRAVLDSAR